MGDTITIYEIIILTKGGGGGGNNIYQRHNVLNGGTITLVKYLKL